MQVEAIILAAGSSQRMGEANKLAALIGERILIRQTVERALASKADGVSVVLGHQAERIKAILAGLPVALHVNTDHASGLSSSLKTGIGHVSSKASGALILLGDMPAIDAGAINRLIACFIEAQGKAVIRASYNGRRGNPVILPRALFDSVFTLEGDVGARHLIEDGEVDVIDVEMGPEALIDIDTPAELEAMEGILQG